MSAPDSGAPNGGAGKKGAADTGGATKGPAPDRAGRYRRRILVAAIATVVVAALVVLLIVVNTGGGSSTVASGTAAGATTEPTRDTSVVPMPPTPTPTGPTENATDLPPALPEVPLNSSAAVGNGIVAALPTIEAIQGTANGPGNIAGPAIRVTVRIQNGTTDTIALTGVAVNMYYGADRTPASPLDDPSQHPFSGTLAAGTSADGVYVFTVPADARNAVTVEVGYQAGAPLLLFTGPVS